MTRLDLNPEEKALLHRFVRGPGDELSSAVFYCAVLAPPIAFAIYGLIRRDPVALFVAFGSLLCLVVWRVWTEHSSSRCFNSLMKKISEFEASQDKADEA